MKDQSKVLKDIQDRINRDLKERGYKPGDEIDRDVLYVIYYHLGILEFPNKKTVDAKYPVKYVYDVTDEEFRF